MKVSKSKITVIVLLVAIIYGSFVAWSIIEYNSYASNIIAEYEELGIPRGYVNPNPYSSFWYGATTMLAGVGLAFACIILLFRGKKNEIKI